MNITFKDIIGENGVFTDGDWVETKDQDPSGSVRLIQLADIGVNEFRDRSSRFLNLETAIRLRCTFLEQNDILVARMPDPIGRACLFPEIKQKCATVVDICIIRPDRSKIKPRWLVHQINGTNFHRQILEFVTGTTRQRISKGNLSKLKFDLPPLEEQKRIAGVLDAAEELRQKRQRSLKLLDELKQSIFVDMFLKSESSDWPVEDIENLSKKMRTGPFGSQLLHSEFVDQGVAVLGIDNAVNNEFLWSKRRYISFEKYDQLKRFTVEPDDVLITIMGTIGRCAVVPQNIPLAINTKHLCSITLDQKKMMPTYLHAAFLNHPEILRQLGMQSKGAVMPGLNMGIIKTLKHPIPPLEIQKKFTERVMVLNEQKATLLTSHEKLDELFTSLQHKAFAGELSGTAA